METEYVTVSPFAVVAVKMTRGPAVLEAFAASCASTRPARERLRVTFKYHFKSRPRWLRVPINPVLGVLFRRDARLRLNALKRAVETHDLLRLSR